MFSLVFSILQILGPYITNALKGQILFIWSSEW